MLFKASKEFSSPLQNQEKNNELYQANLFYLTTEYLIIRTIVLLLLYWIYIIASTEIYNNFCFSNNNALFSNDFITIKTFT